jgi:putative NIF3 family GTP cyclohydrolase 1 type 2
MLGLSLNSVVSELNRLTNLAESWDNVGLLVEPSTHKVVSKILQTNDVAERVMEEAIASSTDLTYSYHPPIFAPLKRITSSSWKV